MGKGAKGGRDSSSSAPRDDANEVLIDGMLYDVTNFRHPGGSIVKYLTGNGDATEAFLEFHSRSEKPEKFLRALPSRPAPADVLARRGFNAKPGLAQDFAKFHRELEKEGMFDACPSEIAYRVCEVVVMHALGAYLLMGYSCWACKLAGLVILGIVQGRCGWLMHEGGHYSLTTNIAVDRILQIVLYGVGCGMSAMWWRNQHNKHHATPQKLKHDVDLDTLPIVAFNEAVLKHSKTVQNSPLLRTWLRAQAFLFIPLSCLLVALGWQLFLHPRHVFRNLTSSRAPKGYAFQAFLEMLSLVVRYYVVFGVVLCDCTWGEAIGLYLFYNFVGASYIFTNFALSHTHLPVSKPDEFLHWVEYAAFHTTNIQDGPICNWWMAYLNFQIEHHLFPAMPQFRHRVISPRVKALFEKHGLKYDVRPYFSCLWETLTNLHEVGVAASKAGGPKAA